MKNQGQVSYVLVILGYRTGGRGIAISSLRCFIEIQTETLPIYCDLRQVLYISELVPTPRLRFLYEANGGIRRGPMGVEQRQITTRAEVASNLF